MGPFAIYIWLSYAVAGLVLVALLVQTAIRVRADKRQVERLEQAVEGLRNPKGAPDGDETQWR